MFTYQLRERARSDRKHIVLPEGDDDRILKSAGRLLQRGIADLTILGDESQIRARAAELGVNLDDATVFDPRTSESVRPVRRAVRRSCAPRRASPSSRPARSSTTCRISAPCWCTTAWSTAWCPAPHTPRRTPFGRPSRSSGPRPACSTVSSIFLMCLPDRVLAYGDCAIVPRPDRRAARRYRDQLGAHRRPVRHRAASGDAVLFHR